MSQQTAHIPKYAAWVEEFCAKSQDPFVRDSAEGIRIFFLEDASVPHTYKWAFSSDEAYKKQVDEIQRTSSPEAVFKRCNALYWNDFARNCEAYSITTCWRASELIRPAIRSLNAKEIVAAAVLARSLLELSATYLQNARYISNSLEGLEFPKIGLVVSQDLENTIVKAMWGSRLGDTPDYLKQKNCLTPIQQLSKNPLAAELLPTYEYLCELAHPNVVGNARFWSHVESLDQFGAEIRIISRHSTADAAERSAEKTIWALAWGAAVTRNGMHMLQESILKLHNKVRASCG